MARDPAGDALAHPQLDRGGPGRQAGGGLDFEQAVVGIEQDDRAAGGPDQPHRLLQDQLQGLLGVQRGMDDIADLIKDLQPFMGRF